MSIDSRIEKWLADNPKPTIDATMNASGFIEAGVNKLKEWEEQKRIHEIPFENVVFMSNDKKAKISHHSFYRYSGITCISKDLGENKSEYIDVTDAMFMDMFMKPIVEIFLK